jgi:hypothetical protein
MSLQAHTKQLRRLRRIGAVVALLGLIFASTIASISHSIAMPMMASNSLQSVEQPTPAAPHGHDEAMPVSKTAGHHMAKAAHDCEGDATADASQQKPAGPCDEGCMLCKDCTMTTFLLLSPLGIQVAERYGTYEPAVVQALPGITPPSPNEPPRV